MLKARASSTPGDESDVLFLEQNDGIGAGEGNRNAWRSRPPVSRSRVALLISSSANDDVNDELCDAGCRFLGRFVEVGPLFGGTRGDGAVWSRTMSGEST